MKYLFSLLLWLVLLWAGIPVSSQAQPRTWDYRSGAVLYNLTVASDTLWSLNPKKDSNITVTQMIHIDGAELFQKKGPFEHGGILADIDHGTAELIINIYDSTKPDGMGPRIYYAYNNNIYDSTFVEKSETYSDALEYDGNPAWARVYNYFLSDEWESSDIGRAMLSVWASQNEGTLTSGKGRLTNLNKPVIVRLVVESFRGSVQSLKIPGVGIYAPFDVFYKPAKTVRNALQVFNNPNGYPNYLMVAAHRGYFRDVADNSLSALRLAIGLNVPMVEIDIQLTKDSVWVLSHDAVIGETDRTILPQRLKDKYHKDAIPISDLTLCELRPDLCNTGCLLKSTGSCEPVWLSQQDGGTDKQPIPLLSDALILCREKVLLNMDKMDKGHTRQTAPYHLVWKAVKAAGLQGKVIVKGKNWLNPSEMITTFPDVDWKQMMYTPTFFPETPNITTSTIDTWIGNPNFACPGFELIYQQTGDPLYNLIPYVKSKNRQVIQFPMWPEYCGHIITDERIDYRNSWNWLLDTPARRPTLIISDRLEVLLQLLLANNLQVGF